MKTKKCNELNCENCRCYNDECESWNIEEHFDMTKSDWDENKSFISNLDPDNPEDEWFFED